MDSSITVDITAPPDVVWRVMSDVERWPEWTASVRSIRKLSPGPFTVGSRVLIQQPRFPPALWVATEVKPGERFTWKSGAPGLRVVASHSLEPIAGGTRATLALTYRGWAGRLMARATRGITQRYLGLEASGLKRRSEEVAGA
jgi:uncharacterized membrane protein